MLTDTQHLAKEPELRFIPIRRPTDDNPRQPLHARSENLINPTPGEINQSDLYWCGFTSDQVTKVTSQGLDLAVLCGQSGVVILDCDVRTYLSDGLTIWNPDAPVKNHVTYGDMFVERRGIDDLAKVVAELGHEMADIRTYAVWTKSGGIHLYYGQNPRYQLKSKSHRENWLVDVKASDNAWCVCPPTVGYSVAVDAPIIQMPDWLAAWIQNLSVNRGPVGGRVKKRLQERHAGLRSQVCSCGTELDEDTSFGHLLDKLIDHALHEVSLANRFGGWNNQIHQATLNLLELGIPADEVRAEVLHVAQPWNEREMRNATSTIDSAMRKHSRNRQGEQ